MEATNLSNELKNAEAKIDQLVGSRKRIIREEFSNSTAPAATCAEIIEFIQKISDAVKQKNVSVATNYAKRITASTATCSEEEKNNLTTKKSLVTEAKNTTESIISEIAVTITETKHKINDVINQMKVVNNYLGTVILNYESTFQLENLNYFWIKKIGFIWFIEISEPFYSSTRGQHHWPWNNSSDRNRTDYITT